MHRGLLTWNIILTVLLIAGFLVQYNYINLNNDRTRIMSQNFEQINEVISKQSAVISEQARVINENAELMNEEYLAAIEENQQAMNEMAELVSEYQDVFKENAIYFEEILENLRSLSLTVTQE
jgi:methyl-accepting chemotaxis protein